MLVPAPDYPLWTAAVRLSGGNPVHYLCDEKQDWQPALDDLRSKITDRTRAMVIINPNNPTGANYDKALLQEMLDVQFADFNPNELFHRQGVRDHVLFVYR